MRGKNGKSQLNGFLDAGSHLRGDLHFEDTFRIDGRLTGKIDSDGDLYVGQQGLVEGEIRVGRLFVSGRVQAVVQAQRVEVAAGGQLRGEVITPCLVIDEGAVFEGLSRMVERGTPPLALAASSGGPAAALGQVPGSGGQSVVGRHEAQRVGG
jgi:cytoskeletal protein CcmA (bactofilin family)